MRYIFPRLLLHYLPIRHLSVDKSGGQTPEQLKRFKKNGQQLDVDFNRTSILSIDSTELTVGRLAQEGFNAFRIFSVDGGHSFSTTLSDLSLATCAMHPAGIVIVASK